MHMCPRNRSMYTRLFPFLRVGSGNETAFGNDFLVIQACDSTTMLCNWSHTSCMLPCINHTAVFWLASTKPRQLTLYSVATQMGCKIIKLLSDWHMQDHDCWACKMQGKPQLSPDPFPWSKGGVWGWDVILWCLLIYTHYRITERVNTWGAVAQWSEHLQLKQEALGSIPGCYPGVFHF